MPFDPDAFIKETAAGDSGGFNPDAFINESLRPEDFRKINLDSVKGAARVNTSMQNAMDAVMLSGGEPSAMNQKMNVILKGKEKEKFDSAAIGDAVELDNGTVIKTGNDEFAVQGNREFLPDALAAAGINAPRSVAAIAGATALSARAPGALKLPAAIAGMLAGGYAATKGLRAITPEAVNELEDKINAENKAASTVGRLASSGFNVTGPYAGTVLKELGERAIPGALNAGITTAMLGVHGQLGEDGAADEIAQSLAEGMLLKGENALGRIGSRIGSPAAPAFVRKPKAPAQADLATTLNNAKAGQPIPVASATANQTAMRQVNPPEPVDIQTEAAIRQGTVVANPASETRMALGDIHPAEVDAINREAAAARGELAGQTALAQGAMHPAEVISKMDDTIKHYDEVVLPVMREAAARAEAESRQKIEAEAAKNTPQPSTRIQGEETAAFNARKMRAIENLAAEGIDLTKQPELAVELARKTDPAEFNKLRQQIIDSVYGKGSSANPISNPEIPKRGPAKLKSLSELSPERVGLKSEEAKAPEAEKTMPQWVKEEMQARGLDPKRELNDIDIKNRSVVEAVKSDPTLTDTQKENLLKSGSSKPSTAQEVIAASDLPYADRVSGIVAIEKAKAAEAPVEKPIEVKPEPVAQEAASVEQPIINIADTPAAKAKRAELAKKLLERKAKVEAAKAAEKAKLEKEQADRLFLTRGIKPKEQGLGEIAPETPPVLEKAAEAKQTTKKKLLEKNHQEANAELAALDAKIEAENAAYPEVVDLAKSLAERGIIHPKQAKEVESVANETKDAADAANVLATALSNAKRKGYVGKMAKVEPVKDLSETAFNDTSKAEATKEETLAEQPKTEETLVGESGITDEAINAQKQKVKDIEENIDFANDEATDQKISNYRKTLAKNVLESSRKQLAIENEKLDAMVNVRKQEVAANEQIQEAKQSKQDRLLEDLQTKAITKDEYLEMGGDPKALPKTKERKRGYGNELVDWADAKINESRKSVNMGMDPTLLAAYAIKGAEKIATGVKDFSEWSKEMLKEYPHLKAHIKDVYAAAVMRHGIEESKAEFVAKNGEPATNKEILSSPTPDKPGTQYAIDAKAAGDAIIPEVPTEKNVWKAGRISNIPIIGNAVNNLLIHSLALYRIHPELLGVAREREAWMIRAMGENARQVMPGIAALRKAFGNKVFNESIVPDLLSGNEAAVIEDLRGQGKVVETITENGAKRDVTEGDKIIEMLHNGWFKVREELEAANRAAYPDREIGHVENYWPREVKDPKKLLQFLNKNEPSAVLKAFKEAEAAKAERLLAQGKPAERLTKEEENDVIGKALVGQRSGKGPAYFKKRTIDLIEENASKFYQPADVAVGNYIRRTVEDLANRMFLGNVDVDNNVFFDKHGTTGPMGSKIADLIKRGEISMSGLNEVKDNIDALIKTRHGDPWEKSLASLLGWIQVNSNLGQLSTVITQLADTTINAAHLDTKHSALGFFRRAFDKNALKLESLGMKEGDLELGEHQIGVHGVADAMTQKILFGLKKADIFMKETLLNGIESFAKEQSQLPPEKQKLNWKLDARKYEAMYGPESLNALKKHLEGSLENPEEYARYAFNKLADIQPISKLEQAIGKSKASPMGKIAFGLTGFMIKSANAALERTYFNAKKGNYSEAGQWGATYMFWTAVGATMLNAINNMIAGKEIDMSEGVVGAALQMIGLNKYAVKDLLGGNIEKFVGSHVMPAVAGPIKDVVHDVYSNPRDFLKYGVTPGLEDMHLVKRIPVVGKIISDRYGEGRVNIDKSEMSPNQKNTLQTISDALSGNTGSTRQK